MSTQHGNFVLLRAGALRLLLPQADVGAAEYLEARPVPSGVPGLLRSSDPVDQRTYGALSETMALLAECPPERFIACELAGAANRLVWCWDELRVQIGVELNRISLPDAVLGKEPPVLEYVELDGAPAYLCSADALVQHALYEREDSNAT